jgi:ferredoxin
MHPSWTPLTHAVQWCIQPLGQRIQVWPGQTLLQAAEAAGLALPSLCRNGTCRECMCHAPSGRVQYRVEWPGLLAEEKAQGWVLPCVALPLTDGELHQPAAERTP